MGYKISPGILTYRWKDRISPLSVLEASRNDKLIGPVELVNTIGEIKVYKRPNQHYAAVYTDKDVQPCFAFGYGGKIDVYCDTSYPGKLVMKENTWSGWMGWIDGTRVDLVGQEWIEDDVPAGKHTYQFRYQPWDVIVGLFICLIGAFLSVYVLYSTSKREKRSFPCSNA